MERLPITDATVRAFSDLVALKAPGERTAMLAAAFNDMVLPALKQLDVVDVGEAQPASSFDPRWKENRP